MIKDSILLERAFIQDMIGNPDLASRLIYADWLEEVQGNADRANFLREAVRIASLGPCASSFRHNMKACPRCVDTDALMDTLRRDFVANLDGESSRMPGPDPWLEVRRKNGDREYKIEVKFSAGMITHVRVDVGNLRHLPALCWQHPVIEVHLTNRHPLVWNSDDIPEFLKGKYIWQIDYHGEDALNPYFYAPFAVRKSPVWKKTAWYAKTPYYKNDREAGLAMSEALILQATSDATWQLETFGEIRLNSAWGCTQPDQDAFWQEPLARETHHASG